MLDKLKKATVKEIEKRFDGDVEEFSNLASGQASVVDAGVSLDIAAEAAKRIAPDALNLLDIGCGAGNYTLAVLSKMPDLNCTLLDLSKMMLNRAFERVSKETKGGVKVVQGDIRTAELEEDHFDIVVAGAVLHHLRDDKDWEKVFNKLYMLLKRGGCLVVSDFIVQNSGLLTEYMMEKYADYLEKVGGKKYRRGILSCIAKNDTPKSMTYQLSLTKKVGFRNFEILHKNMCFGTFCAVK